MIEPNALSKMLPKVFEIKVDESIVPNKISIFAPSIVSKDVDVLIKLIKSCSLIVVKIVAIPSISVSQFLIAS